MAQKNYNTFQLAEPEGGRRAYKKYLEQSIVYPEQAIENKIEGKVTVQFTIEPTGQLTDFRVVRGIGSGCDEEVIRIIKQGPKWTPTKRSEQPIRGKVKVRMKFDLPEKK
jgi:TonB family protein